MDTFSIVGLVIFFVIAGVASQHMQRWMHLQTIRLGPLAVKFWLIISVLCLVAMYR